MAEKSNWYWLGAIPLAYLLVWYPAGPDLLGIARNTAHGSCQVDSEELAAHSQGVSGGLMHREYSWHFDGADWSYELDIPVDVYEEIKASPRPMQLWSQGAGLVREPAYSGFVLDTRDDQWVSMISTNFRTVAVERGWDAREEASFVLAFVQCLAYTSDQVTTGFDEYPRYPLETLADNGGDCEDTAILYASLMDALGTPVILISPPGHMAAGVGIPASGTSWMKDGATYYYAETTGSRQSIGDLPSVYRQSAAQLYSLEPGPVLAQVLTVMPQASLSEVTVELNVTNFGSTTAHGVLVEAHAQDEQKATRASRCEPADLEPGYYMNCRLTISLEGLSSEALKIVVDLSEEGKLLDRLFKDFEPRTT